jgi:hypothetical protein
MTTFARSLRSPRWPRDRRGDETSYLASIALMIVVLILVVVVGFGLRKAFTSIEDELPCIGQIRAAEAMQRAGANPTIDCPVRVRQSTGEDQARETIAGEMRACWKTWSDTTLYESVEGTFCQVCSMIYVSDATHVRGLAQYLDEHKAPEGVTYSKLLTGRDRAFSGDVFTGVSDVVLPADVPVGVLYIEERRLSILGRTWNELVGNEALTATGAGIGGFAAGAKAGLVLGSWTGVGAPIAGAIGGVGGATVGVTSALALSTFGKAVPDSPLKTVVVRPLDEESLRSLDCKYVFD